VTAQVAQIIDVQLFGGQEILNVYHFVDTSGVASIPTLVSTYISDVVPLMADLQSVRCTHTGIRYRQVYPTAALQHTTFISPPTAGADSANQDLASCDALSIAWDLGDTVVLAGGFTGHLKRGGTRIGGSTEGFVNGDTCPSAAITAAATFVTELLLPGTGPWQLVVASFLDGARARQPTVQSYAIVDGGSAPSPSTQNTRKVLRGRTR